MNRTEQPLVAAAQYLRMSTEEQRYSLDNQAAAIAEFARTHGFTIVKTYRDAARSGLTLAKRDGLRQLLSDIASGQREYTAVLVYDVSRWGRFQDADESAHYEFLCRSAGVSLHYCFETFDNDGSLASTLMKALKRSMAGEFSRELGMRVYAGKREVAAAGFHVGGRPPFGLRRRIIAFDETRCRILEAGERKYVRGERMTLVPGPADEVSCVRNMFRSVIEDRFTAREIARNLNARGMTLRGRSWTQKSVHYVLTNPEYAGFSTWGRSSQRLGLPRARVSPSLWILVPHSFRPIVSKREFEAAQRLLRLENGRVFWTKERVLRAAKKLWRTYGKLSYALFDKTPGCPNAGTVRQLGFPEICRAVGYELPKRFRSASTSIKHAYGLHLAIVNQIAERFPSELSVLPGPWARLSLDPGIAVSVLVSRRCPDCRDAPRWRITPRLRDMDLITIVCLLDSLNTQPVAFFLFPRIGISGRRRFGMADSWLNTGDRVDEAELCSAIRALSLGRTAFVPENSGTPSSV